MESKDREYLKLIKKWDEEQEILKKNLILEDCFSWQNQIRKVFKRFNFAKIEQSKKYGDKTVEKIKEYLSFFKEEEIDELKKLVLLGVDISYSTQNKNLAAIALVALNFPDLQVVYEDVEMVKVDREYKAGYLFYRESPLVIRSISKFISLYKEHQHELFSNYMLNKKINKNKKKQNYKNDNMSHSNNSTSSAFIDNVNLKNSNYDDDEKIKNESIQNLILFVDANGTLHPKGFGMACQLGTKLGLPCIGVAKNIHLVEGLSHHSLSQFGSRRNRGSFEELRSEEKELLGVSLKNTNSTQKPIFVSPGNMISTETSILLALLTSVYRIPEPTRQADIRSRDYLRKYEKEYFDFSNMNDSYKEHENNEL